ncbi:MAG: hypothetical protein ACUVTW_14200 [Thermogutta sp.]
MWRLKLLVLGLLVGPLGLACQRSSSAVVDDAIARNSAPAEEFGPPGVSHPSDPGSGQGKAFIDVPKVVQSLVKSGWDPEAAQKVAELNLQYMQLLQADDPEQYQRHISALMRLGDRRYFGTVTSVLKQCPEIAGLLAASTEVSLDGPIQIAETLTQDVRRRQTVLSLYLFYGVADEAVKLARLLNNEGKLVLRLYDRGAWYAVQWLIDPPDQPIARPMYRQWVRDVLESALSSPDDEALESTQVMMLIHSATVRELLSKDERFRDDFRAKWWPTFSRELEAAANDEEHWSEMIADPRVWSFFSRFGDRGAAAWKSRGWPAIELLMDERYSSCREKVFQALEKGDELVLRSLLDEELRSRPLFVRLLERSLPPGSVAKALEVLWFRRTEVPFLLDYWARLSNEALIEELGPPPEGPKTWVPLYSVGYLIHKWSQGRNIDGWDWFAAATDAVDVPFLIPAMESGNPRLLRPFLRQVAPEAMESVGTAAAESYARRAVRESGPWGLRQLYHSSRKMLATQAAQSVQIEITQAVRLALANSDLGRSTFKRLTGLEARVFMRADRVVGIDLPRLVSGNNPIAIFLRETAINAGIDLADDIPGVQETIHAGVEAISQSAEQLQAWKTHASAWWFGLNLDVFDADRNSRPDSK